MNVYKSRQCRFYIEKILKLKDNEEKFSIILGNLYHHILELALKEEKIKKNRLEDNYKYFQSCYCSGLPHIIDEYEGEDLYTEEDMEALKNEIEKASDPKEYKVGLNFNDFRYAFADLVAMIEEETAIQKQKALEAEQTFEYKS